MTEGAARTHNTINSRNSLLLAIVAIAFGHFGLSYDAPFDRFVRGHIVDDFPSRAPPQQLAQFVVFAYATWLFYRGAVLANREALRRVPDPLYLVALAIAVSPVLAFISQLDIWAPRMPASSALTFSLIGVGLGVFHFSRVVRPSLPDSADDGLFEMRWRSLFFCALIAALTYCNVRSVHWPNEYGPSFLHFASSLVVGTRAATLVLLLRRHERRALPDPRAKSDGGP